MNQKSMLLKDIVGSGNAPFPAFVSFANENSDPVGQPIIESTVVKVKKITLV
jgi:hypothetical protein